MQAGGLERQSRQVTGRRRAERAERAEQAAGRLERRASDGQATGRSIQAVAKTGRGRPIMTETIGAGKFRAS